MGSEFQEFEGNALPVFYEMRAVVWDVQKRQAFSGSLPSDRSDPDTFNDSVVAFVRCKQTLTPYQDTRPLEYIQGPIDTRALSDVVLTSRPA
ncbi:hypothetical protein JOB18_045084 [Solea senegalensis]|uniref:Uncharacterized protein n=1 Tax=Solea senegalensis TaxID=28829 RepID=A0AAV6QNE7_SOLSE|nr:hypothetical protein JOB18_045084 [Solea senegalensis]